MTKHILGDGTTAPNGDVAVVTPSNMGVGLKYNPTTKRYEVDFNNVFEIDENGQLSARVSKLEDNLLSIRSDGLYVGNTAEQAHFYVDSANGSDTSGDGTVNAPYRTFMKAVQQIKPHYDYTIFLEENGSYQFDNSVAPTIRTLSIQPYGSMWTSAFTTQGAGRDYCALSDAIKRPTLTFIANTTSIEFFNTVYRAMVVSMINNTSRLDIAGINIKLAPYPTDFNRAVNYPTYLGDNNIQKGEIVFTGCNIDVPAGYTFINHVQNLSLIGNVHTGDGMVWKAPASILPTLVTHHQIAQGDVNKFPTTTGKFRVNSTLEETLKRVGGWTTPVVTPTIMSNVKLG
ncbi:hypothetical protein A1D22_05805 [Pasteurellaceae bacterium LFhippo2]|nr:hypothetical protein [Pasteurellaceae bacterium LFhippo2]